MIIESKRLRTPHVVGTLKDKPTMIRNILRKGLLIHVTSMVSPSIRHQNSIKATSSPTIGLKPREFYLEKRKIK